MRKNSKIILALLTAWLMGCSQAPQSKKDDEKAIKDTVKVYQEAYNQQDAAKLTSLWASEATYINPVTGESAEGREAIEKLFKDKFATGEKKHLEIRVKSIEFLNADEAIENGVMKVTASDKSKQQMAYQARFIRENGKWLVDGIKEIELQDAHSNFEELKDLAWLVGKWEDTDDNVDILFDNQWDKGKNFIIGTFKMEIYGEDDIEGKQIIAWDPAKSIIRSWVFDSDGGFGEGTWEKVDNSWYATMHYTLGDGGVATSKNIYTPIDNNSYTYASVEREVDGEILPDMNPATVKKIK